MDMYIWGAGDSGISLCKSYETYACVNTAGIIDSNPIFWGRNIFGFTVLSPDNFSKKVTNDTRVCISTTEDTAKAEIFNTLIKMGVTKSNIEFRVGPSCYDPARFEFVREFSKYVYDRGIKGNVAECGVFDGRFAAKINRCFYDRKIYLFDTFEGFDERDVIEEKKTSDIEFTSGVFSGDNLFSNTSVEKVLSNIPLVDNVIIKKGWVPESFMLDGGVNDTFCFVNLDMDLYPPMFEALKFFWDKMEQGGIILCHEYTYKNYTRVKEAVYDFEKWVGHFVPKTTIGDNCSIALIKP